MVLEEDFGVKGRGRVGDLSAGQLPDSTAMEFVSWMEDAGELSGGED